MNYLIIWMRRAILALAVFVLAMTVVIMASEALRQQEPPMRSTMSNQIASLDAWRDHHQESDDEQFKELKAIQQELADLAVTREHRLTALEQQSAQFTKEMESLQSKLWLLIAGVLAQLLHTGLNLITSRTGKPAGKRDDDR